MANLHADVGRPLIVPEHLLMEQRECNLLFRWVEGLAMDEQVWNQAVFSRDRQRLPIEGMAEVFFQRVLVWAKP